MAETEPDQKQPVRTPSFSDYLRVFGYATRWDLFICIIASLASIGAGITLPLMNVIFGQLTGQFTQYSTMTRHDFQQLLDRQALYIMALFLGRWALNTINKFCFRVIAIHLSSAIRLDYLQSLLAQPVHVIDSMPPGAPAISITATTNTLQLGISERLGTLLESITTIISAIIIAFIWSWSLALVTSSLMLYIMFVLAALLPLILKSQTATTKADAEGTAVASEALGGVRLVMACGAQDYILSRYQVCVTEALKRAQKMSPLVGSQVGLLYFGTFGAFGLAFWYGTQRYITGAISSVSAVIIVLMSVMMVIASLGRIAAPLMAVSKAMVAACELFIVIDAPSPASGSLRPDIESKGVIFDSVTFEYPSRPGVKVLDAVSFRIQPGRSTAFVGPSGSGKSTVCALLEKWYSLRSQHTIPQVIKEDASKKDVDKEKTLAPHESSAAAKTSNLSGSITIGGHNLEDLDTKWWRTQIGIVQQEPFLFNGSIYDNVVNGLLGSIWEHESAERKSDLVREACHEAYAHEFIDRLPDGYDTKVGDGGIKLSGGQKQRIAIARSIVKKPRIIIFDEATSAVDAKSEKLIQLALDRVAQNRTTITIAHRLSTIRKADHIVVFQRGQAIEQGTHQDLSADSESAYSKLIRAQSLHIFTTDGVENDLSLTENASESEKLLSTVLEVAGLERSSISQEAMITKNYPLGQSFKILLQKQRKQWLSFLVILLSAMAAAAAIPIQAWLFAKALGVFLADKDHMKKEADFWGLMWFVLAASYALASFCEFWLSLRVQYAVSATCKIQYFTDMLQQRLSYFDEENHSHGTLTSLIASDAKLLEELFGINLAVALTGIFNVVGCIIIALVFSWKLGLVAMFLTMPIMLSSGFWKYRQEVQFDQMDSKVFAESSQFATEAIGAIRTVSALTMEGSIIERYSTLLCGHVQVAQRKALWTAGLFGFVDSAGLGCQALIFWYGGQLLIKGEFSYEAFFVCYMAMIQGAEAASQILSIAPNSAQAASAANRIFALEDSAKVELAQKHNDKDLSETEGGVLIELRDVSFKYPTRDVIVFQNLNLTIEKGQYAAIVGPSGCGKTTIISLLERFYDLGPDQGTISCNGININDLDVNRYRRNLSLVAQEPTMFQGTVRDNILFGMPNPDSVSDEKIQKVCRDALIHDFITSLPDGYQTDVGQKGVAMSGGQKQRIAIARALIRNPKILLLDEATSALDSESEQIVQAAFERARAGRTMIAVAHRLSTIQNADVIFVFDDGRIVEKGSHVELVRKRGVYWDMCQNQALD